MNLNPLISQYNDIVNKPEKNNFNHLQNIDELTVCICNPSPIITSWDINGGKVITVDNLINSKSINDLLSLYNKLEFKPVGEDGYAKNWLDKEKKEPTSLRASIYSTKFVKTLSDCLSSILPVDILVRKFDSNLSTDCRLDKDYYFLGINPYLRLVKYNHNSKLVPHYDGHYVFSNKNIQTIMTCLIYLNDCSTGATTFLSDKQKFPNQKDGELLHIKPKAGKILLFDQNILHTTQLTKEPKKLILTDYIMGYLTSN